MKFYSPIFNNVACTLIHVNHLTFRNLPKIREGPEEETHGEEKVAVSLQKMTVGSSAIQIFSTRKETMRRIMDIAYSVTPLACCRLAGD
ncbi:hypothetical protein NECAME_11696 [Necator americanus]|uniref:Uncharacterized protein n=1 Tax=Necator americanus TaxID=51031 RepID=W2T331_NECAM|nr:hypothetical protein NECAME_11696 [Necator americanus]ETN76415.1 hypothetical protein NECAME_11696 [Necator americanus]